MSKFLTDIPMLPANQSETPWAHIYFKPAQGQLGPSNRLSFSEFSNIVRNTDKKVLGVHALMHGINSAANGFVARQIENNDPSQATLTLRWWHDGIARFDIPLNMFDIESFIKNCDKDKYSKDYCDLVYELGYSNIQIVDYSIFVLAVASLTNSYLHMLNAIGDTRDIYSCFTLRNVFHTSPFVDSDMFMRRAIEYSIPLTKDKNIVVPSEPNEQNMIFHEGSMRMVNFDSYDEYKHIPFLFSMHIVYRIFEAAGIVADVNDIVSDTEAWGFNRVNIRSKLPTQTDL